MQNNDMIKTIDNDAVATSDLDDFIRRQMNALRVEGMSLAIVRDNKIVFSNGYGYKNSITKEKVTTKTVFEACSLSKPVFAYLVLKLVEKGFLELDRPLYEYLPLKAIEHDELHKLITARMVLCHTSGLPNWRIKKFNFELKLIFYPGSEFLYSGTGYQYLKDVLCYILKGEEVALEAIFKKEVVQPLDAKNMGFILTNEIRKHKAFGHQQGRPTNNKFNEVDNTGAFSAAHGLNITPIDYAKFLSTLMVKAQNEKSIDHQILAQQFNISKEKGELHRSLAFPVKKVNATLRYFHVGNNGDFQTYCHFYKDKGFGIVMMANSDNFFQFKCAQYIIEFLGDKWLI